MLPEMLDWRLKRMKAWYHVTLSVVRAEFPDFAVIRAFSALNLAKERRGTRSSSASALEARAQDNSNLERLAQLLVLDADKLKAQVLQHRPIARRACIDSGCSNFDAWKEAFLKTRKHAWTRQTYPADVLHELLIAYGCMGGHPARAWSKISAKS